MVTETTTLDVDRDHDLGLGIVLVSGVGQTDLLLTLGDGGIGQQTGLSARNRHPILTGAAQRSARCRGVVLHRQRASAGFTDFTTALTIASSVAAASSVPPSP